MGKQHKKTGKGQSAIGKGRMADTKFEDHTIASVKTCGDGWEITFEDGWSFFVPTSSTIAPRKGMVARLYGDGLGAPVRGLTLDGVEVFYASEAAFKVKQSLDMYGKDAADWLARWDSGKSVWSMECGGFGPGYEQAIQIAAAEILRDLLSNKPDAGAWSYASAWKTACAAIENRSFKNERIKCLGLSGNQFGAALTLAAQLYKKGPVAVMKMACSAHRSIQVSRHFPRVYDDERAEFGQIIAGLLARGVITREDVARLERDGAAVAAPCFEEARA